MSPAPLIKARCRGRRGRHVGRTGRGPLGHAELWYSGPTTPAGAWLRTVVVDSSQRAAASMGRYGWASAEVESAACLHA
jgi:hypothetical protein